MILAGTVGILRWWVWQEPLNLVLITLDTTRADRLMTYGYYDGLTAAFDRYASDGVFFSRAYTSAPITLPAHTSMLTGLYPPEHGLRLNGQGRLSAKIPVLPELLKSRGYETAAFVSAAVLDSTFGLNRGFDLYDDYATNSKSKRLRRQRRLGADVVDSALKWLGAQNSKPFFCWVHLFDAHAPYELREDLFGEEFRSRPYDAGVAVELREVERIMEFLKQQQLDKNTLVIVTADHGEGLGEHGESEHGMLAYNSTLHVPLIFVGSKYCLRGQRVSTSVSLVDIVPTVLDILKLSPPDRLSGRSLKNALAGRQLPPATYYAEAETPYSLNRWCPLHVVISDRWKFIQTTRPELYDLQVDPSEQRNLFDEASQEAREQQNVLDLMQQSFHTAEPQTVQLTDNQLADLNALGYAGVRRTVVDTESLERSKLKDVKDMLPAIEKFDEAKRLSLTGQLDGAIPLLRDVERMTGPGEYLEAGYLLGDCLTAANRADEAVEVFLGILDKHPDIAHTHFRLAMALSKQGRLDRAAEEFRTSLQHEPDSATTHWELARVLARADQGDEAIVEYHQAIRAAPAVAALHVELGQLHLKRKHSKEAVHCFEQALKFNPRDGVAQTTLLSLHVQMGEQAKAVEIAIRWIQADPKCFEAHYNLGILLLSLNRMKEGISELRQAQRLRPDDPRVSQRVQQAEAALTGAGR